MQLDQQRLWIKLDEAGAALAVLQFTDAQQSAKPRHQRVSLADGLIQRLGLGRILAALLANPIQLRT
ncbi:hypothetical protein D3C85_1899760 [compost metagenome]